MTTGRVDLVENGPAIEIVLSTDVGSALAATGFVDARPLPRSLLWSLRPLSKVGAIALPGLEVHVAPKIPIARVVFLMEHTRAGLRWRQETVDVERAAELLVAVVEAFERLTSRALQQGLLQGYRSIDEALPVVRGRIRESDQLRKRFGLPLPVEVRYDDFTVDTAENRLLRAAVTRARRLPGLPRNLRHRLLRLDLQLTDVTPVNNRGALETWRPTRLNARFHHALRLAEVIVESSSFEPSGTGLTVTGFVLDMAKVFEDFVCAALGAALRRHGGTVQTQDPWFLDRAGEIAMKPDLVWYDDVGLPRAVTDAKYKAEKPDGFPNADMYQLLAYCTALRLPVGHLVYANGNEARRSHLIRGVDVVLQAHTLDLAGLPAAILTAIDDLASKIALDSASGSSRSTRIAQDK